MSFRTTTPGSSRPPSIYPTSIEIADIIVKLASQLQLLDAEIIQINEDINYLEEANRRYSIDTTRPSSGHQIIITSSSSLCNNNNNDEKRHPYDQKYISPCSSEPMRRQGAAPDHNRNISRLNLQKKLNKQGNRNINGRKHNIVRFEEKRCFSLQIGQLRDLKVQREVMAKDIRQHLQLYAAHAVTGSKLLLRVNNTLGTQVK
eukprot:Tbor_TRINITY_DN1713_c0_g1::TRINITY_DN1713_c0_g1_i1::g.21322::m.21322